MPADPDQRPVLVVMGVSGSGKSTVAGILADRLGWDLAEGDDLHPPANVVKMAAGRALTDEDRRPWLESVASWITDRTAAGVSGIITCSALKRSYRDVMRGPGVVFVHLAGSGEQIGKRLAGRSGHFMPASLLGSQLTTLEPPGPDENAIEVNVDRPPAQLAGEIIRRLGLPEIPAAAPDTRTGPLAPRDPAGPPGGRDRR